MYHLRAAASSGVSVQVPQDPEKFFFPEKLDFFPKDEQNQSNLCKQISNGSEKRKSILISFKKFWSTWNWFT